MYCQVTQIEQQGGPEAQREMVRDREQAVYERMCVSGWKWIFCERSQKRPRACMKLCELHVISGSVFGQHRLCVFHGRNEKTVQ